MRFNFILTVIYSGQEQHKGRSIAAKNRTKHSFVILGAKHNIIIKPFVKQSIRNFSLINERNVEKK